MAPIEYIRFAPKSDVLPLFRIQWNPNEYDTMNSDEVCGGTKNTYSILLLSVTIYKLSLDSDEHKQQEICFHNETNGVFFSTQNVALS